MLPVFNTSIFHQIIAQNTSKKDKAQQWPIYRNSEMERGNKTERCDRQGNVDTAIDVKIQYIF